MSDRQRTNASNRTARKTGLGRRHAAWHEWTQIHEVPAVERDGLDRVFRDNVADRGGRALDEGHVAAHDDVLRPVANRQGEIAHDDTANVNRQRLDDLGAKSRGFRDNAIDTGRKRPDVIVSVGRSVNGHAEAASGIADGDGGVRDRRS
jgi:hypothetical protein